MGQIFSCSVLIHSYSFTFSVIIFNSLIPGKMGGNFKSVVSNLFHELNSFFFFFSTQLYFTIFTFLFVTTRQSSTYQQSITDFKVRTLVCIRTLVTSDNTYTPNNAPKATGNGLIQYGTVITRSILLNFSQEITHSLPVRARNGCLL